MINNFTGDFRFLSNFFPCRIEFEGINFPSVEHAYQAAKTTDISLRTGIARLETPGKAKRAGKELVLRSDWEEIKVETMRSLLKKKFCKTSLKAQLLATQPLEIVEGNTWGDTFWGVCDGSGENHLGKLLMEIRAELVKV